MHIALVTRMDPAEGGPSLHILRDLVAHWVRVGHSVTVLCRQGEAGAAASAFGGASVCPVLFPMEGKASFIRRYLANLRFALRCARPLRALRGVDAVFLHSTDTAGLFVLLARRCARAPILLNVQDIFPENAAFAGMLGAGSVPFRLLRAMQRYAYRRADLVQVLSEDMAQTLIASGARADRVHVVPLWTYADDLSPVPWEENPVVRREGLRRDVTYAVYAGNLGAVQNVGLVLDAADLCREDKTLRFLIVGDGAKREALVARAAALALTNLDFLPAVPSGEALALYSVGVNLITLHPGVIRTAFPSKTVPCLAAGGPMVLCVDEDSRYARALSACDNVTVAAPGARGLVDAIARAREEAVPPERAQSRALYRDRYARARSLPLFDALLTRLSPPPQA